MAYLGLIPLDMTPSSLLNIFPRLCLSFSVGARLTEYPVATHRHFEGHYMTFYPSLSTLQQSIDTELRHLLHREQESACGRVDPGRLRYSGTYAYLHTDTPFDVYFDIDYGSDTLVNYRNRSVHATYRTSSNQYLPDISNIDLAVSPAIMIWMRTSVLAGIHPRTPKIDVSRPSCTSMMRRNNTFLHLSGIIGIRDVPYAPLVCHPSDVPRPR
jgi:hypothetical protein